MPRLPMFVFVWLNFFENHPVVYDAVYENWCYGSAGEFF